MPACRHTSALALLLLSLASFANAEPTPPPNRSLPAPSVPTSKRPDTLPQLIDDALRASPELAAYRANADAASGIRRQAGLWPNPEFTYSTEDRGTASESRSYELAQRLELGGKPGARANVAENDFRLADLTRTKREIEIAARVRAFYYQLGLSELRLSEAETGYEIATRFSMDVERRAAAGKVAPIEATKAKTPTFLGWNDLLLAQQEHEAAQARLASLVGRSVHMGSHTPALPDLRSSPFAISDSLLNGAPNVRLAKAQVDRQRADLELQRRLVWPDLQVRAATKTVLLGNERSNSFYVSVPFPFFDRNQGAIAAATSRLTQAESELSETTRKLQLELAEVCAELNSASRGIELYEQQVVPTAESAFRAARQGYDLGKFPFIDVLDAQRSLIAARSERLAHWNRYIVALEKIEAALGQPMQDLINRNSGRQS